MFQPTNDFTTFLRALAGAGLYEAAVMARECDLATPGDVVGINGGEYYVRRFADEATDGVWNPDLAFIVVEPFRQSGAEPRVLDRRGLRVVA